MTAEDRRAARRTLRAAVRYGKVNRPDSCQDCGASGPIDAHHADYSKPLEVDWLCGDCHRARHAGERRGVGRPTRPRPAGSVTTSAIAQAEREFQSALTRADELRERRNAMVRLALDEGWTHAHVADATGMSRGRVGQIAKIPSQNT